MFLFEAHVSVKVERYIVSIKQIKVIIYPEIGFAVGNKENLGLIL